jgi:hypothetical protein
MSPGLPLPQGVKDTDSIALPIGRPSRLRRNRATICSRQNRRADSGRTAARSGPGRAAGQPVAMTPAAISMRGTG